MNPSQEIKNISGYLNVIQKIYEELGPEHDKGLFFRGQADASHNLTPSTFRSYVGDPKKAESGYLLNYRDNMPRQNSQHDFIKERTEILVDMQHYEIPTRLLDWTFSPLIALYFATLGDIEEKRSKVFVFNPWEYAKKEDKIPRTTDAHAMHVLGRALLSDRGPCSIKDILRGEFYGNSLDEDALKYPFPFVAKYGNPRIIHQSGCFTIQGTDPTPLDQLDWVKSSNLIWELEIPNDARKTIRDELNKLFINDYSVFPDLAGMSHHLESHHSLYSIRHKK